MIRIFLGSGLALALVAGAIQSGVVAQAPSPIDPIGTYTVATADDTGVPLSGTLTVRAANGTYAGEFVSSTGERLPFLQLTTNASHIMAVFDRGGVWP